MRLSLANIERWVWYIFLATFAWQTRLILWQADRQFIEWRSISLYASDVLMLALFVLAAIQLRRTKISLDHIDYGLIAFLVAAGISIHATDQFTVSIYQWLRLAQYVVLFWYVRYRAVKFPADAGLAAFVVGAIAQSWLALGQYIVQHDLGFRWLGETLLTTHMPGVAVFYDVAGTKILRAYGTLPHPNILAAYLMAGLWALAYLYLRHADDRLGHHRWIWAIAGVPMVWALYLTFSRTMIAVGLAATLVFAVLLWWDRYSGAWPNIKIIRVRARQILIVAAVASIMFAGMFWRQIAARAMISPQDEAVTLRVYYAREAIDSGGSRWLHLNWTGIGMGNFVSWLQRTDPSQPSWAYQPAHDLYLLVYSETGILGMGLFALWLALVLRVAILARRDGVIRWGLVMVLAAWLLIALFDHFFWTLQQGRVLFWLTAAYAAADYGKQSNRTTQKHS